MNDRKARYLHRRIRALHGHEYGDRVLCRLYLQCLFAIAAFARVLGASAANEKVGDDGQSWAVNSIKQYSKQGQKCGYKCKQWKDGDVIGLVCDLHTMQMYTAVAMAVLALSIGYCALTRLQRNTFAKKVSEIIVMRIKGRAPSSSQHPARIRQGQRALIENRETVPFLSVL